MIKYFDKNKDGFVSIDEYLATEINKGPEKSKSKSKMNYHYQNSDIFFNFFTLLILKKIKEFQIVCIPNFEVIYNNKYIYIKLPLLLML